MSAKITAVARIANREVAEKFEDGVDYLLTFEQKDAR